MLTSGNLLGLMNVFPAESALSDKMLINGPHRFPKRLELGFVQNVDLQVIGQTIEVLLFHVPIELITQSHRLTRRLIEDFPQILWQGFIPAKVDHERVGSGGVVGDGDILGDFMNVIIPNIRGGIVLPIYHTCLESLIDLNGRDFLRVGSKGFGCLDIHGLRWDPHVHALEIIGMGDGMLAIGVGAKALGNASGRNVKAPFLCLLVQCRCKGTLDQGDGLIP